LASKDVAAELGHHEHTVGKWRRRFVQAGIEGLTDEYRAGRPRTVTDAQVARLEGEIDALNRNLEPLRSFVLPGGSAAASFLHLARTVSRRAERLMVALAARPNEPIGPPAMRYINRLSDFLFVAARTANDKGRADVLWVPGKNR